jgi:hypothetical protein
VINYNINGELSPCNCEILSTVVNIVSVGKARDEISRVVECMELRLATVVSGNCAASISGYAFIFLVIMLSSPTVTATC